MNTPNWFNRAFEAWQEYRYMLDPTDERSLVDLILEEYDRDVESAMRNPVVKLVFWVRRVAVGFGKSGGRVF